ncbi:histidine kinase [Blautia schinkii]|nr:histidine kinase [Blautia schinkii]
MRMRQLPFQKKLFLSISACMAVLMLVCIMGFSLYTYNNLNQQSLSNLHQLSERTGSEVKTLFENMDALALYASTNPEIRSAFSDARTEGFSNLELSRKTVQTLTSISIPNSASHYRISLYNENGNFTSVGIPYQQKWTTNKLASDEYRQWYEELPVIENGPSFYGFHPDYWSDSGELYLSLFREIFGTTSTLKANALIEIQCPLKKVKDILNFDDNSYTSYLFDPDGNLVYPLEGDKLSDSLYDACRTDSQGYLSQYTHLFYSGTEVRNGFHLILTQSQEHIWGIILPQILAVLFLGAAALIIFVVVIFYVTKHATKPLQDLTSSVKQVSISNLSLELDFADYPDEISGLNTAFDKMFQRLRQSMDEIVRIQACEMRANMVALQSQMDPHFLYNTLTVIKAFSREKNNLQINMTCDYLVKMLRYISSYNEHNVSLKQELDHTENYLNLMKIRYEDQFSYTFSIDSNVNTETLMVPRLTLQPLVENCFQHGFKTVAPPWTIHLRFWLEGPQWYVSVTDNGAGFSPDSEQRLLDKIDEFLCHPSESIVSMKIGGMGLVNTVARLKLKYKNQISFKILNPPEGGTSVIIGGVLDDEYLCD